MLNKTNCFIVWALVCIGSSYAFNIFEPKKKPGEDTKLRVAPEIQTVHVIFMNHLDVGYDGIPMDGIVNNVLNTYFTIYFPRAIKVYEDLKKNGFVETFKYTTHPWLVDMYLNCPPNMVLSGVLLKCPNATTRQKFINAVNEGVFEWHAGPMNTYYEVMSPITLQMSLNVSRRLDVMFKKNKPVRVVSQRDVPGMTVGAIPQMVENDIIGFTNGINSGSAPPEMPLIARWRYGDKEILYVQNPAGYPNNPGPVPNNPGGIGSDQCRWLPGMTDALCFAFRTDNSGPPVNYQEVLSNYEVLRGQFPNAKIFASSLETFFGILSEHRDKAPIRRNEVGDTWVQGAGSDPRKAAEHRTIVRVLAECEKSGLCDFTDHRLINASRFIVKLQEHTYGLNSAYDNTHWNNVAFQEIKNLAHTKVLVSSWLEQRNFTYMAIAALQDHPVAAKVKAAMTELKAEIPSVGKNGKVQFAQTCTLPAATSIHFAADGSIDSLVLGGKSLVSPPNRIGQLMYRTYNETDTGFFLHYYSMGWNTGFGKIGSTKNAHPSSQWWPLVATTIQKHPQGCAFDVRVQHKGPEPEVWYGGAAEYWITYNFTSGTNVDITVQWNNKTATRLMEAIYMNFSPNMTNNGWLISKVGHSVCPYSVVQNGSQWQQGFDEGGVTQYGTEYDVNIKSMDTLFVSPWTASYGPTVWPAPLAPIPATPGIQGMAFPLTNNVWDTNFIFWYPFIPEDSNYKARFQVSWNKKASKANPQKSHSPKFRSEDTLKFRPQDLPTVF